MILLLYLPVQFFALLGMPVPSSSFVTRHVSAVPGIMQICFLSTVRSWEQKPGGRSSRGFSFQCCTLGRLRALKGICTNCEACPVVSDDSALHIHKQGQPCSDEDAMTNMNLDQDHQRQGFHCIFENCAPSIPLADPISRSSEEKTEASTFCQRTKHVISFGNLTRILLLAYKIFVLF
jgi:hypothetical protein